MIKVALFVAYTITTFGITIANDVSHKIYADSHRDDPNKHKDLERISRYEIIQVDTTSFESSNIIELDAFNNHYKIELIENNNIHPGLIRHRNGILTKNGKQFYTNLNKTCHFHGHVLNTNESSMVALSICDKRGIRGSITAFGDTIEINPANYYLDLEYNHNKYHDITDKHLVYLQSEYDITGFPMDESIETNIKRSIHNNNNNDNNDQKKRRRLAYNSGKNKVELYVMSDPVLTNKYQSSYSDDKWYEELVSYFQDMINRVSAEFEDTNWGNQIGDIIVSLVEIEVVFEFNGIYASLDPVFPDKKNDGTSNCKDHYNTKCEIDGSGYLSKFKSWVGSYKVFTILFFLIIIFTLFFPFCLIATYFFDSTYFRLNKQDTSTFDDAQLWSYMNFKGAGGWGYVGTVCKGKSATANIAAIYTDAWSVRSAAHELGMKYR